MLALGEGKWTITANSPLRTYVTVGYRNDRLYLVTPKDEGGSTEYKIIFERVEPANPKSEGMTA